MTKLSTNRLLVKTAALSGLLALSLGGCGANDYSPPPLGAGFTGSNDTARTSARSVMRYAAFPQRNRNHPARYFLVAGGQDNAGFAQEVIEQKKLLLNLGVSPAAISCFYTIPPDDAFAADELQYRSLAADLSACYPAHSGFILQHIAEAGARASSDSIYVYVTSHGNLPLSLGIKQSKLAAADTARWQEWLTAFPQLDQFLVSLDALADGAAAGLNARLELLAEGKASVQDLFFTPRYLKQALQQGTSPETKKYVVVQACYSGGFLDADDAKFKDDTLAAVEHITVITAARHDRTSFGCGAGNHRTFFGGAFNDMLTQRQQLPANLNWQSAHQEVARRVRSLETSYLAQLPNAKKKSFKSSEPQFFSNNR